MGYGKEWVKVNESNIGKRRNKGLMVEGLIIKNNE